MTPTRTWMSVEMRIARHFGSEREKSKLSPDRKESCDFLTPDGGQGEVKLRKVWPSGAQTLKWWMTLQTKAQANGRYPILCVQVGGQHGFWYAVGSKEYEMLPSFIHTKTEAKDDHT